jgi:hypothetical protein
MGKKRLSMAGLSKSPALHIFGATAVSLASCHSGPSTVVGDPGKHWHLRVPVADVEELVGTDDVQFRAKGAIDNHPTFIGRVWWEPTQQPLLIYANRRIQITEKRPGYSQIQVTRTSVHGHSAIEAVFRREVAEINKPGTERFEIIVCDGVAYFVGCAAFATGYDAVCSDILASFDIDDDC